MSEIHHSVKYSRCRSDFEEEEQPTVHILPAELIEELNISSTDITLTEYLKDNYTPNTGSSVSDYFINNYPPKNSFDEQHDHNNHMTMVPLRKASYSSNCSDSNVTEENHQEFEDKHQPTSDDELKKARRRMKNKISAQESRRRKKEYVDALELKMKQRDQEKKLLTEKVTELEEKVRILVDELFQSKQNQNDKVSSSKDEFQMKQKSSVATQTGICLHCFTHPSSDITIQNEQYPNEISSRKYFSYHEANAEELDANCHDYTDSNNRYQMHHSIEENLPSLSSPSTTKKEDVSNSQHFSNNQYYDNYKTTEKYNNDKYLSYSTYPSLHDRAERRVYYEKPYVRRTVSVSPRLMKMNTRRTTPSPPQATCTTPLRSNSLPLRSSTYLSTRTTTPPKNDPIDSLNEYRVPIGSSDDHRVPISSFNEHHRIRVSDSYCIGMNRQEISLYSQLMNTERELSPK